MSRRQFAVPDARGAGRHPTTPAASILHVDMDAFYASASLLSRPELRRHARSSSAVAATAAWCSRRPTRPAPSGWPRRCRWPGPAGCARRRPSCSPTTRRYERDLRAVMATFASDHPGGRAALARRGLPRRGRGRVRRLGTPDRRSPSRSATPSPTSRASPARSGWPPPSSSPSSPPAWPSPTGCSSCREDEVVTFLHQLPVGALWGVGDAHRGGAAAGSGLRTVADIAHTPRRHPAPGAGRQRRRPPARPRLGPRHPRRSCPTRRETEHRRRRDLRPRHRRPRRHPPPAAQAQRPYRGPGPRRRHGRPHRHDQGALRRLHDDHPVPDPARPHRRQPRDLRHRPCPVRRTWACNGPGSGWSGCAWRASPTRPGRPSRDCSTSPSTAGARPTARSTGPAPGSVPGRSVPPVWSKVPTCAIASPGRDLS